MNSLYPDASILVFCKAPVAGQVKTRLIPELTAEQAANVHKELTQRLLSLLFNARLCSIQLWCSPDSRHPFFADCVNDYSLSLHQQQGHDLGERMHHAITTALKTSSRVLLVGCDCPSLTATDFNFAINALNKNNDVLLSPAEDGGYVMIGMKKSNPTLFSNMKWGSREVLDMTRQRIEQANLNCIETQEQWDVDVIDDLNRYQKIRLKCNNI